MGTLRLTKGKNPAIKRAAKIFANSMWGKLVEGLNKPETKTLCLTEDFKEICGMFDNVRHKKMTIDSVFQVSDSKFLYKTSIVGKILQPNFHKSYAPAGIMVPAYGRLCLLKMMNQLGKDVIYNDTDSVIFYYDPDKGPLPEIGDALGEWSEEDISKKGIMEFFSHGPKTYGLQTIDGDKSFLKAKGLSLTHTNSKITSYDEMFSVAKEYCDDPERPAKRLKVPQQMWGFSLSKGMQSINRYKYQTIAKKEAKGIFNPADGYIWPFGSNQV